MRIVGRLFELKTLRVSDLIYLAFEIVYRTSWVNCDLFACSGPGCATASVYMCKLASLHELVHVSCHCLICQGERQCVCRLLGIVVQLVRLMFRRGWSLLPDLATWVCSSGACQHV